MQSRLQITLQDMSPSAVLDKRIRDKVGRLEKMFPRLTACRVVISAPHRHQLRRRLFTVRLNIVAPGGEVVITRDNHEDIYVLLRDAFAAARRELTAHAQRRNDAGKRDAMLLSEPSAASPADAA